MEFVFGSFRLLRSPTERRARRHGDGDMARRHGNLLDEVRPEKVPPQILKPCELQRFVLP